MQKAQFELADAVQLFKEPKQPKDKETPLDKEEPEKSQFEGGLAVNKLPSSEQSSHFVTLYDVAVLLENERQNLPREPRHFTRRTPYPVELLNKTYLKCYDPPTVMEERGMLLL